MLKITKSSKRLALKVFRANNNEVVGGDGNNRADETFKNLLLLKKAKNKSRTRMPNIGATKKPEFLIPGAKEVFN